MELNEFKTTLLLNFTFGMERERGREIYRLLYILCEKYSVWQKMKQSDCHAIGKRSAST